MPWSQAGVDHANSYGVYGDKIGLNDQLEKLSLNEKPDPAPALNFTGWNMPASTGKPGGKGGKSKRSNSRKKIRKNRRANKTRRYKK
jgi:hypothetical protein